MEEWVVFGVGVACMVGSAILLNRAHKVLVDAGAALTKARKENAEAKRLRRHAEDHLSLVQEFTTGEEITP